MISPFVGAKVIEKFGSLRFWDIRERLWIAPAWPTNYFPRPTDDLGRQWAVLFLLSYSNYGTCANSPFVGNPLRRRDKRPF